MEIQSSDDTQKIGDLCSSNPYIHKPTENEEDREFFVVKENGILSCAYLRIFLKKIGNIGSVFVRKDRRREGIGSYLVGGLEERLKERGASIVLIGVHEDNEAGLNFWEENGYKVLIDSAGEKVLENSVSKEILEKISPTPLPDKGVTLMGKRFNDDTLPLDKSSLLKEIEHLKNSFQEFNVNF